MKTVAFVPIKLNSERLPGKNIKKFTGGKPLIQYILETLTQIKELDGIYVYCSDEIIKQYLPPEVKFVKRDKYYDLSTTPFNMLLKRFATIIEADIYVLAHATAPFIKKSSISLALEKVKSGEYDSALSVTKVQEFLWKGGKPMNYDLQSIPRTQDLPIIWQETCGLYVYRKELIMNEEKRIGSNPYLVKVSKIESIDINTEEDYLIANAVFQSGIFK